VVKKQNMEESNEQNEQQKLEENSDAENWFDLANHLQAKVLKRTSDVTFLHTKAGFLIAAAVIELQILSELPKFTNSLMISGVIIAALLAIISLILSVISMNSGKSATPLNPDDMILTLTEQPHMTRRNFANWLAKSYAATNSQFNTMYNTKYTQQIFAAGFLVASFVIIIILKGINTYV